MLMPEDGHFNCAEPKCGFSTCDLFEYMYHCGVEYAWAVRLNKRYAFDLFEFLATLNDIIEVGDLDAAYDHIQSATLLMVNASGDDLQNFVEEAIVRSEMDNVMAGVEGLLKENE
jgi:hypothetical protein